MQRRPNVKVILRRLLRIDAVGPVPAGSELLFHGGVRRGALEDHEDVAVFHSPIIAHAAVAEAFRFVAVVVEHDFPLGAHGPLHPDVKSRAAVKIILVHVDARGDGMNFNVDLVPLQCADRCHRHGALELLLAERIALGPVDAAVKEAGKNEERSLSFMSPPLSDHVE